MKPKRCLTRVIALCLFFHIFSSFRLNAQEANADQSSTEIPNITSKTVAYRWHLPAEVIPFKKDFKAAIEVGSTDNYTGNYESIAYYYLKMSADK